MVKQIDDYFAAWNEPEAARRRALLESSVTPEVELVHPTWGRSQGIDALLAGIVQYRSALPGAIVVLTTGLDSHNHLVRYGWQIVDPEGRRVMAGMDVVELAGDGRLKRILLFHEQPAEGVND
jgi:hypothetical protein